VTHVVWARKRAPPTADMIASLVVFLAAEGVPATNYFLNRSLQETSQRAIAALERLLAYKDDMVAVLSKHGKVRLGCCSGASDVVVGRGWQEGPGLVATSPPALPTVRAGQAAFECMVAKSLATHLSPCMLRARQKPRLKCGPHVT